MKRLTTEEFIGRAKVIHGDLYDYSKTTYVNSTTKVIIICEKHGEFNQNPRNHLKGNKCKKCIGRDLTNNEWISRFKAIHGEKFDYRKFRYTGIYDKSVITCRVHGDFKQTPHNHSQGQQCPKCSQKEAWTGNSYYNTTNAIKNRADWLLIPCSVYVVKMSFEDEVFYKIGITNQDIDRRFRKHDLYYSVEIVDIIKTNRYEAILLENKLHRLHSQYKHLPEHKFKGYTECFTDYKGLTL